MSTNEIKVSLSERDQYMIYPLYELDVKKGTAKLCIFTGPIDEIGYNLEPTNYMIHCK